MRKRAHGLSRAAKLVAVALLVTLVPVIVLSVLQYRSLIELQAKTKVAVQENLRQTLERVARRMESKVRSIATDSLLRLSAADLRRDRLEHVGRQFAAIRSAHPEVQELFVVSTCACGGGPFAVVATAHGPLWLDCNRQSKEWQELGVSRALSSFEMSRPLPGAGGGKEELTFDHGSCPFCPQALAGARFYAFRVLSVDEKRRPQSVAGLTLKPEYLAGRLLDEATSDLLGGSQATGLALAVTDDGKREIWASGARARRYEATAGLAPLSPRWNLAIGYRNTTIELLAAEQLRRNVILTALVLCGLVLGLGLALRAISREARLAELKSAFVSNVSHEMKTPLALIRMFAETLELGRVKSADKMQEYFRVIHNESRRLSQLIDNILDFAKMEAGRKEYQCAPGDVAEVVESVLRSYEDQITSAGFDLAADLEPRLPAVLMDANALSQAVLNILSNAVKYSAEVKKIRLSVSRRGEHVAIEVADSGIGIPRSEHARIFEKFHRVSAPLVHNTKGSGLGLTLCKHIVEAHGGRILVESAPGQGSRFTILLPAALAVEAPPEAVSKLEEHAFAEGVDRRG